MGAGKYTYKSDFAKKYFALGRVAGRAADLLLILERREIEVDELSRERIDQETDEAVLAAWIGRALQATTLAEVFDTRPPAYADVIPPGAAPERLEPRTDIASKQFGRGYVQGLDKGHDSGHARGMAAALLRILDARGIYVDDPLRESLAHESNPSVLKRWIGRAALATELADLFVDD